MKITILGSGTSQGVPVIACDCEVCRSNNPKDNRLRSSIMIDIDSQIFVIDTGPDFRQQMLRENVQHVDAVIFTHHHKDHVAGMDDIRAFNHKWKKDVDVFCNSITEEALHKEFSYIFSDIQYPGTPKINIRLFSNDKFNINNIDVLPIEGKHYLLPVFGFRIHNFVYLTDVSDISEKEKEKMRHADLIVLGALQRTSHISHFSLDQALALLEELKPKRALLTHISHFMGLHDNVNSELPSYVQLAFDGQKVILKN